MLKRKLVFLAIVLSLCLGLAGAQKRASRHSAPTFYIATSAQASPEYIFVRGATNLPAGAKLIINIYDCCERTNVVLNQESIAVVGKDGFFETKEVPKPGVHFHPHLRGSILFMVSFPNQEASVLLAVGKTGEKLGAFEDPQNPQAQEGSGQTSLEESIFVQ
jgi:hypothetical protein